MADNTSGEVLEVSIPEAQRSLEKGLVEVFGDKLAPLEPHAWREYGLTFGLKREDAVEIFAALKDNERFLFNMLVDITAVDWMDVREPRFDVVYQLLSLTHNHRLSIKIEVDEDSPKVDSVLPLWPAANFLEREVWDMFGIEFEGHGDLRRILLYDEFVGHPLRKDYPIGKKQPRVQLRVPELHNTSQDMNKDELVSLPVRNRLSE